MNSSKWQSRCAVAGLACLITAGAMIWGGAPSGQAAPAPPRAPAADPATQPLQTLSDAFAAVAQRVQPSVVSVHSAKVLKLRRPDSFGFPFRFFFDDEDQPQPRRAPRQREYQYRRSGVGSGFVLDKQGHLLTNYHVVQEVDEIKVTLTDKRVFDAEIVGTDPKTDLAVIRIKGKVPADLPVVALGDSDTMRVGDWVLAFGAPFGYDQTMTAGIISAKSRGNVGAVDYEDFIQTDAAINPGNSGGPLVNIRGEVIGINTIIATGGAQQFAGVGFAIPINMAKTIVPTLVKGGTVSRGMLGVGIQNIDEDLRSQFKLPDTRGALVSQVNKGSPADKAGIQASDVIVRFNGQPIEDSRHLRNLVAATAPGTKAKVAVLREGRERTFSVELGQLPASEDGENGGTGAAPPTDIGLSVQPLTPELARQFNYADEQGVVVSDVEDGSAAATAGLRVGDLITEVNRTKVDSVREFNDALANLKGRDSVMLLTKRGGTSRFVIVRLKPSR